MKPRAKTGSGWVPAPFFTAFIGAAANTRAHRIWKSGKMALQGRSGKEKIISDSPPPPEEVSCPCAVFKLVDRFWHENIDTLRPVWNAALKRPFMSGYELFMKENLTMVAHEGRMVSVPSVSGGFSTNELVPGPVFKPGQDIEGKAPMELWACIEGECHFLEGPFYESEEICIAECKGPPMKWTCLGHECIEDQLGEFETYEACVASGCLSTPCPCNDCTPGMQSDITAILANFFCNWMPAEITFSWYDPDNWLPIEKPILITYGNCVFKCTLDAGEAGVYWIYLVYSDAYEGSPWEILWCDVAMTIYGNWVGGLSPCDRSGEYILAWGSWQCLDGGSKLYILNV